MISTPQYFRGKQRKIIEHQTTTNATHAWEGKETFQNYRGGTWTLIQANEENAAAKNGGEEFIAWTWQSAWILLWRFSELTRMGSEKYNDYKCNEKLKSKSKEESN